MSISLLKNWKQFTNSSRLGLSPGGTHLSAVVIYASFSFNPSFILSEFDWFEILTPCKHLYKKSDDLSPVNTLPVLVPPCAAGASPTKRIFPFVSPNPVIGLPQ